LNDLIKHQEDRCAKPNETIQHSFHL